MVQASATTTTQNQEKNVMVVTVSSAGFEAGNFAKMTINETQIDFPASNSGRGLHMAIIDPRTGKLKMGAIFDTYKSSDSLNEFIAKCVPQGDIVVAACKDDCS